MPQVIVPQMYDQHYFARRVQELGIGTVHAAGMPATESLAAARESALRPEVREPGRRVAAEMREDGAARAG